MTTKKTSDEFKTGVNAIGYIGSNFIKRFGDQSFEPVTVSPSSQVLTKNMSDASIESDLKPGLCTLGDVLAVIQSDEYRDGELNFFYFEECVVSVRWYSSEWSVGAWGRDDHEWGAGDRVFSPQLVSSTLGARPLESSETLTLVLVKDPHIAELLQKKLGDSYLVLLSDRIEKSVEVYKV